MKKRIAVYDITDTITEIELNDEKILADLYINLGELYSDISKEKELEYYQKGVCIYKNLEII